MRAIALISIAVLAGFLAGCPSNTGADSATASDAGENAEKPPEGEIDRVNENLGKMKTGLQKKGDQRPSKIDEATKR